MSARVVLLRDALGLLLATVRSGEPLETAEAIAENALAATAFALPVAFPAEVPLRGGGRATLIGAWNGSLYGALHDGDELQPYSWNLDGSYYALTDPDENDIVVDEAAPVLALVKA